MGSHAGGPRAVRALAVIGGRGWLGRATVAAARRRGLDVTVVSRTPGPGVVAVDPEDRGALAAALAGCDAVVNAAGGRAGRGATATAALRAANEELPDRLGGLAAEGRWRLLHVGSAAEYGPGAAGPAPVAEDHPCDPASAYGRSKLAGTEAVRRWRGQGAPALVARVFNVVDADLPADNPVHELVRRVRAAVAGGAGEVGVGDPSTTRDLMPRADVADALVALAVRPVWPAAHEVLNVCTGTGVAFGDLVRELAHQLGAAVAVRDLGWPRGGRIVGDPRLLRSLVDVRPAGPLDRLAGAVLGGIGAPTPACPTGEQP